jgi:Lipid A 3-O-deacylase (PagL)
MRNTPLRTSVAFIAMLLAVPAMAGIFSPQDVNVLFGEGRSLTDWHGSSAFTSVHFEGISKSPRLESKLGANAELVAAISYSDVRQPRSWFGHRYGDPDDHVRAESLFVGARKNWRHNARIGLFAEIGTGPMWSNRRVPAATSRLNFDSQFGLGAAFHTPNAPLYLVYRFEHVSNGGIVHRNPGLQVFSFAVGTRALRFRR